MVRRRFTGLAILLFAAGSWYVAAAAPVHNAKGPPPDPCTSTVPDLPNDLQAAFAYDLESPSILHFVKALADIPQRDQQRVFDAAADAASSPAERDVEKAVAALCPNLDEMYGASRAFFLIASRWKLGELADEKRSGEFSTVVTTAMWSLSLGDRLPLEQRRSPWCRSQVSSRRRTRRPCHPSPAHVRVPTPRPG